MRINFPFSKELPLFSVSCAAVTFKGRSEAAAATAARRAHRPLGLSQRKRVQKGAFVQRPRSEKLNAPAVDCHGVHAPLLVPAPGPQGDTTKHK